MKRDLVGPWEAWSEKLCISLSGTKKQEDPDRVGVDVHIRPNDMNTLPHVHGGDQMFVGVVVTNR